MNHDQFVKIDNYFVKLGDIRYFTDKHIFSHIKCSIGISGGKRIYSTNINECNELKTILGITGNNLNSK
jgi:hypothetical protein